MAAQHDHDHIEVPLRGPARLWSWHGWAPLPGGRPVPIAELARRRDIPLQFLEQLFATLRRAGMLQSQRGVKGGYTFMKDPAR